MSDLDQDPLHFVKEIARSHHFAGRWLRRHRSTRPHRLNLLSPQLAAGETNEANLSRIVAHGRDG